MQLCRPVLLEQLAGVPICVIANLGNIVAQRIQPDINHMFGVEIYWDSPRKRSPGNAQILQPRQQEIVHHLIFAGHRLDKFRVGVDMRNQAVCIFAHLEEIGFLLGRLDLAAAVWAFPVHKLGFCPERLAGGAVEALISALVNIALFI